MRVEPGQRVWNKCSYRPIYISSELVKSSFDGRPKPEPTRSNVVSVLHSFFGWAEAEDIIELDPSRKIRRPPKRKPDIYRPSVDELERLRAAALPHELAAILLMEGAGLRRSEVVGCRWAD